MNKPMDLEGIEKWLEKEIDKIDVRLKQCPSSSAFSSARGGYIQGKARIVSQLAEVRTTRALLQITKDERLADATDRLDGREA